MQIFYLRKSTDWLIITHESQHRFLCQKKRETKPEKEKERRKNKRINEGYFRTGIFWGEKLREVWTKGVQARVALGRNCQLEGTVKVKKDEAQNKLHCKVWPWTNSDSHHLLSPANSHFLALSSCLPHSNSSLELYLFSDGPAVMNSLIWFS